MRKRGWILIPISVGLTVLLLFKTVFLIGYVPTKSMEPTLKEGSIILGVRHYNSLNVGDIIVFEHEDILLVKRIVATEGETVEFNGKSWTVPKNCFFVVGDNTEQSYDSRYWEEPFVKEHAVKAKILQ